MKHLQMLFFAFAAAFAAEAQTIRTALFVGNSYTYFNQMSRTVSRIAASLGDSLEWENRVGDRYSYAMHCNSATTYGMLYAQPFDVVFLQEYHVVAAYPASYFEEYSLPFFDSLSALIEGRHDCSRVFAAMPWSKEAGDDVNCITDPYVCSYEQMYGRIVQNFQYLRTSRGVQVAPWGVVWDYVRTHCPWIDLYDPQDRHHPSKAGSYLLACINYTLIFRKSPQGGYCDPDLPAGVCQALQQAVWDVLPQLGGEWGFLADIQGGGFDAEEISQQQFLLTSKVPEAQEWFWETASGEVYTGQSANLTWGSVCPAQVRHRAISACDTLAFEGAVSGAGNLKVTADIEHPLCGSIANGSISLLVENTSGLPTLSWSTGEISTVIDELAASTYSVTISDPSGCTSVSVFVLENEETHSLQVYGTPACNGAATGNAAAWSVGDGSPTQWLWSNGATTASITQIVAGTYTVTSTFSGGCTTSFSVVVGNSTSCVPQAASVSDITDVSFLFRWQPSGCAQAYRCEYRKASGNTWEYVSLPEDVQTFVVSGLTANKAYEVRLKVRCDNGEWLLGDIIEFWTASKYFYDADLDGFGVDSLFLLNISPDEYFTQEGGDCNDADSLTYPNASEYCDNADNDCDGQADEDDVLLCKTPAALWPAEVSTSSITLAWTPMPCVASYHLRYKGKQEGIWQNRYLSSNILLAELSDIVAGGEYWFSIRTVCGPNAYSEWSPILKVIASDTAYPFVLPSDINLEPLPVEGIWIQPNPIDVYMWVRGTPDFVPERVEVVNLQGIIVMKAALNSIPVSVVNLEAGLYFVRAFSADGRSAGQLMMKI